MRTTDDILTALNKRAAAGEDVRQQIVSHETLARLRAELAAADRSDVQLIQALESQIHVHSNLVDEDVDPRIVEQPKKDSAKLVRTDEDPKV